MYSPVDSHSLGQLALASKRTASLLLNLRSPRDCGSCHACRRAVRACGTSLVRWMALQCALRAG